MRLLLALLMVIAAGLLANPTASQEGSGVIIEGNPVGAEYIGTLNPLRCNNANCERITDFLFPSLLAVDPANGVFRPSTGTDYMLATGWDISEDGRVYTFRLRDDLRWSDGTPITAYDVFFTYLDFYTGYDAWAQSVFSDENLRAVVPLDDTTIAFAFDTARCDILHTANTQIIPYHSYDARFAADTHAALPADGDLISRFEAWQAANGQRNYNVLISSREPHVTAGVFELAEIRPTAHIRLRTPNGQLAYTYLDVPDSNTAVNLFLEGRLNLITDPPIERLNDIRAAPDVQFAELPGYIWDYISLNLADPTQPQNAFDDDGQPLDQGVHPLFGDVRVRRAIQMGIDVPALIDAALLGTGTVMPANQPTSNWGFNPDLAPVAYNPLEARRLLDEAGWRDWNGDGIRECRGCLHAPEGMNLSFQLLYAHTLPRRNVVANLVRQQLRQIGIDVYLDAYDFNTAWNIALSQRYDAYLGAWRSPYPHNPDQSSMFTRAADMVHWDFNIGSYHNERVEELMQRALTLPGCDPEQRAALYREIQTLMQADQPYIWLYTVNQTAAARGSIRGFAPYPEAIFWNIDKWVIRQ